MKPLTTKAGNLKASEGFGRGGTDTEAYNTTYICIFIHIYIYIYMICKLHIFTIDL